MNRRPQIRGSALLFPPNGVDADGSCRFGDLEIPANLASKDRVDLRVPGDGGNFLGTWIHVYGVPAAFPQLLASVLFQMPD